MFATLLGPLPRPPLPDDAPAEALLDSCLGLQAEHGLEPATDGGWPLDPGDVVESWRATADRADRLVKAVIVGPISSGRGIDQVHRDLVGLADAGCRWIEVHEPASVALASSGDPEEAARFADAHDTLTRDLAPDVHLTIAITGGNADGLGIDAVLAGAYASLAVDLIDGPDNWRLAVAAPTERGVICGAVSAHEGSDDGPETLLWAARYAAGSKGRGMARVGLATSGSMAGMIWEAAATKVRRLGDAVRIITLTPEERRMAIDPRAVDIRSAALGRVDSAPPGQGEPAPSTARDDDGE
jgi:hypothetical protein